MNRLDLLEKEELSLSDSDRTTLAAHHLDSLPADMSKDDAGITEASCRDNELDEKNNMGITWDTLLRNIGR